MSILDQIQQMLHSQECYDPPDAVCMTQDRYEELIDACTPYLIAEQPPRKNGKSVFGLRIFVDRHSPISYVAIGKAWFFAEKLKASKVNPEKF